MRTAYKLQRTGMTTALLTLTAGGLIAYFYHRTLHPNLLYLEYLFILLAVSATSIVAMRLYRYSRRHKTGRRGLRLISALLVVTLAAALLAFRHIIILSDTLQINLVNHTSIPLTNIRLTGCQRMLLPDLEAGGQQTVRLRIQSDCSVMISYAQDEVIKNEVIAGFVTTSMGRRITYRLGE